MSPVQTAPAQLTAADARLRAQYLDEVLGVLYPGASATAYRRPDRPDVVAEYLIVPHARRPRLLVPTTSRRVAAAAVRRYAEPQTRLARLKREAVVAALRTGTAAMLLRDRLCLTGAAEDSIDGHLREALGRDLVLSVHIGPARANRKPVLQLLTRDGDTIGFAKLGTGALTRELVRAEAAALTALSRRQLRHVRVPAVLHAGQWRGHEVLVQSALPIWQPRAPLPPGRLTAAMREVAASCGLTREPLSRSAYWAQLRDRLAAVADRADGATLAAAAQSLVLRAAEQELEFGAWHGDWAPWNMANLADALLVWDWERFTPGAPVGFDAVHHELQRRISIDPDAGAAVDVTVRRAGDLLEPFGVDPAARELTALLYLVDLAARYLADRQAEAGARLGVLGTWLLPVLLRRVAAL
ncbi:MAG TPA: phosphotransferase [Pilimelia sp.]|nr:phosphotransferase [Pilimelia sp.]